MSDSGVQVLTQDAKLAFLGNCVFGWEAVVWKEVKSMEQWDNLCHG